jgi:hypothetical protein
MSSDMTIKEFRATIAQQNLKLVKLRLLLAGVQAYKVVSTADDEFDGRTGTLASLRDDYRYSSLDLRYAD